MGTIYLIHGAVALAGRFPDVQDTMDCCQGSDAKRYHGMVYLFLIRASATSIYTFGVGLGIYCRSILVGAAGATEIRLI